MLRAGGLVAAALYGNIGIKVIYNNVLMELLSGFLLFFIVISQIAN